MTPEPTIVPIALPPMTDVADHAIAGKATVPAVFLLDLLVGKIVDAEAPLPLVLKNVAFPRFLLVDELPKCTLALGMEPPDALLDIRAAITSRIALAGDMTRTRVHLAATVGGRALVPPDAPVAELPREWALDFETAADRVYSDLVRFGPRFRSLRDSVRLGWDGASAIVASPSPALPTPSRAGCPFLFDGAMHLACVWGQRFAGYVAYPTGFATRIVTAPLAHGRRVCRMVPREVGPRRLTCDLWLGDEDGTVHDAILGLTMAPLAAGPPPPDWIVHPKARFRAR
jgi:hypothetical protein